MVNNKHKMKVEVYIFNKFSPNEHKLFEAYQGLYNVWSTDYDKHPWTRVRHTLALLSYVN